MGYSSVAAGTERCSTAAAAELIFLGREKFVNRETNLAERFARVVGVTAALFLRNAEIVSGNEHLHVTFELYDCENTDGDRNHFFLVVTGGDILGEFFFERAAHPARNRPTTVLQA